MISTAENGTNKIIMKKLIFILFIVTFIVIAEETQPDKQTDNKYNSPELEMTEEATFVTRIEVPYESESIPNLELSPERKKQEIEFEWREKTLDLELTPKNAHHKKIDKNKTPLWKIMGSGLMRGIANVALSPGEIVRGFTYEFTARKWYNAIYTSGVTGLGGFMVRMGAGFADFATFGCFGDVHLFEGFPDYVWQGTWVYKNVKKNNKTK